MAVIIIALALFSATSALADTEEEKNNLVDLELVYPIIPGETEAVPMNSGLPGYVSYIYRLAMALIGLIIFGVLIYNGIKWFTSFGSAEKLSEAKKGITSAFLGAVILFSAFIIFRTINPQLTILKLTDPDAIEPVIPPGIYICNYDVEKPSELPVLSGILHTYTTSENKENIRDAVKSFRKFIKNDSGICSKIPVSANFKTNFVFTPKGGAEENPYFNPDDPNSNPVLEGKKHSVFHVPEKTYVLGGDGEVHVLWEYNYGVIFHEDYNMKGKCKVFTYEDNMDLHPDLGFKNSYSITIFKKPESDPAPENKGVILYECVGYNQDPTLCLRKVEDTRYAFLAHMSTHGKNSDEILTEKLLSLGLANKDTNNPDIIHSEIRSIQIEPEGGYFAVLFDEDNLLAKNTCEVITKDDNNLLDNPIGQCGDGCNKVMGGTNTNIIQHLLVCYPCTKSILVIKGEVL